MFLKYEDKYLNLDHVSVFEFKESVILKRRWSGQVSKLRLTFSWFSWPDDGAVTVYFEKWDKKLKDIVSYLDNNLI